MLQLPDDAKTNRKVEQKIDEADKSYRRGTLSSYSRNYDAKSQKEKDKLLEQKLASSV